MDRYLTKDGLSRSLAQGRTVEQWLGARTENGVQVLKWLSIEHDQEDHDGPSTLLRISEVLDEGGPHLHDIYGFTPYDANAEFGVIKTFETPEEALQYAIRAEGADEHKFVGDGVIQLEYADYLKTRN